MLTLTRALFVSKVDFCCSLLAGVSGHLLGRLQLALSAAARLGFSAMHSQYISPTRCSSTFSGCEPCSPERIQFRLSCVLTYRCLNGTAPSYLAESIRRVADLEGRRHLHSSASTTLKPRLHDTTGCQTRCQTGCTTRFDNRLNEKLFVQHGCQTVLVKPVVKPV